MKWPLHNLKNATTLAKASHCLAFSAISNGRVGMRNVGISLLEGLPGT